MSEIRLLGFSGKYPYRIDPKGRVPIPPDFRQDFRDGAVLMEGAEKCVIVCPPSLWQELVGAYASNPLAREKERRLNRALFAAASVEKLDTQGRVPISAPLREYAGIAGEALVIGAGKYLEIWDKDTWEKEQQLAREARWQTIESQEESKSR